MASEILVIEIREISKACTSIPVEELISNPDWGKLNFNEAKSDLDRAFNMFNDLLILPIDLLPDRIIQSIINNAKPLQRTIDNIKIFDITSVNDAHQKRDEIIGTLKSQTDHFYMVTEQWIAWLMDQEGNIQRHFNEITNTVTR